MSERIYARLLRLFPSRFRKIHGDAALQLFRDRSRDENGLLPSLWLWVDLLADLAVSVPRAHRCFQPALLGASAQHGLKAVPGFQVLDGKSLRSGALLLGAVFSLITFSACAMIGQLGNPRPLRPASGVPQAPLAQPPAADRTASTVPAASDGNLDAAERKRVIDAAIANLKQYYIHQDAAQKIADALLAHEKRGDYDAVKDGPAFAVLLTTEMRDVSHDMHLDMVYSQRPLPDRPPATTPESRARYKKALEEENCTFENVEILAHNIGYLKLNSFPDAEICQSTARRAMSALNQADAIIFDLRDNRGGYRNMVMLIAAYLFDHPEFMFSPRDNITEQSWTRSPVPGNRLADKPVYVLTSGRTISAAEQFSYDLKMLKRATFVGETTGGAAHAAAFHRIVSHFGMGIPETRPINPFSATD